MSGGMQFRIQGVEEMLGRLKKMGPAMQRATANALWREAERIIGKAKSDFVPVDLAVLKNSGGTDLPVIQYGQISVDFGFGGAAEAYALAVHEHPGASSPPSWRGAAVNFKPAGHGPKYLERAIDLAASGMAERIAADVRSETGIEQ